MLLNNNADIGFGFDGDGDRCGVIDNEGKVFSDKIGLLIARNLSTKHANSKFIVDVKSTGLFNTDNIWQKIIVKRYIGKQDIHILKEK